MKRKCLTLGILALLLVALTLSCYKKTSEPDETVATPTFSPEEGIYTTGQLVTINCSTEGAAIRYTTNGTDPTEASSIYTSPLEITSTTTIKAIGFKDGWARSATASTTYTISELVAAPEFDPPGGSYTSTQYVRITCSTNGATIRYTSDGSDPTDTSAPYTAPLTIRNTTTIKARGFKESWVPSATASACYMISLSVAAPEFNPAEGQYQAAQYVELTCATSGAEIRYTTDGSDPTDISAIYTSPLHVLNTIAIRARGYRDGWEPSAISSATYTINYTPIEMIQIPGGTFIMGDTHGNYYSNELPTHSVTLNSFSIGKYELTQGEFASVMGFNPATGHGVGNDHPVYNVSWYSAIKYCNLRSMADGLAPVYSIYGSTDPADWGPVPESDHAAWNAAVCNWNSEGYRLPTEAEWEYAARGAAIGPDYLYSGSDQINDVAWYHLNDTSGGYPSGTKPVGQKAPNSIGTHDMSGNVIEWCWDWYSPSYYSSSPSSNPTGPASGSSRVARNSGWNGFAGGCRVSYRYGSAPHYSSFSNGFRVCRSAL